MKRKYHLVSLLIVPILAICGYFIGSVSTFTHPSLYESSSSLSEYISLFVTIITCLGAFVFYDLKYNRTKYSKVVAIAFALLVVENIIVISSRSIFPFISSIRNPFDDNSIKAVSIFSLFALLLAIYIALLILPQKFASPKTLRYLIYLLFAFGLVMMIYSYITEYKDYVAFVKDLFITGQFNKACAVQSFTSNTNLYGMILLALIFMSLVYHALNPKWWKWIVPVFIYGNMLVTGSRGSVISGLILIGLYILSRLFFTIKAHKIRNTIALSIIFTLGITAFILCVIALATKGTTLPYLSSFLLRIVRCDTLTSRYEIWVRANEILSENNGFGWIFGKGYILFNTDLGILAHNGVIELMGLGGIFALGAFLTIFVYLVYLSIKHFKKIPTLSMTSLIGALTFIIYSQIESNEVFVLIMFVPVLLYDAQVNAKEAKIPYIEPIERPELKFNLSNSAVLALLCVTPLLSVFMYPLSKQYSNFFYALPAIVIILLTAASLLIGYFKYKQTFKLVRWCKSGLMIFITSLVINSSSILLMYFLEENNTTLISLSGLLFVIINISAISLIKYKKDQIGYIDYICKKCDSSFDKLIRKVF